MPLYLVQRIFRWFSQTCAGNFTIKLSSVSLSQNQFFQDQNHLQTLLQLLQNKRTTFTLSVASSSTVPPTFLRAGAVYNTTGYFIRLAALVAARLLSCSRLELYLDMNVLVNLCHMSLCYMWRNIIFQKPIIGGFNVVIFSCSGFLSMGSSPRHTD